MLKKPREKSVDYQSVRAEQFRLFGKGSESTYVNPKDRRPVDPHAENDPTATPPASPRR